MQEKTVAFQYEEYRSAEELSSADAALLQSASEAIGHAYAPYSGFRVGAAARLINGATITGSNQENASFPAGLCAERTLLSVAAAQYPGVAIEAMAITYDNSNGASDRPITPCGICRQSLQEYEHRTGRAFRLILSGSTGPVLIIPQAGILLPFAFTAAELG